MLGAASSLARWPIQKFLTTKGKDQVRSPVFLVGSALATLWAGMFHLFWGKRLADLIFFWFIGLIGFAVGQAMAEVLSLSWMLVARCMSSKVHAVVGLQCSLRGGSKY